MILRATAVFAAAALVACTSPADDGGEADPDGSEMTSPADSRIFDMPYLMREMDNGLRVIVVRTDYPDIVTLRIPVQTGSRNEVEPGKSGFAHFFEHMMFRGTERYPSEAYSAIQKNAGVNSNASTWDDYTNYYLTFTKPDLEKMIELEADRFQNLSYSESDFRTEALAVNGEYLKNYSNPLLKGFEKTRNLSFDVHPYGHVTMGYPEDIQAMPEQLEYSRLFFNRWYRPEYTSIIVVGDIDPEATFDLVEKYWGGWERGDYVADIPTEPDGSGPKYEHIQSEGDTQPWLFLGFRSPAFNPAEKDYPAMGVLSSIYFSNSSDLYQELVIEKQWVDQLSTDFPLNTDPNLNFIYIRLTDEAHASAVEQAVLNTLARARTELIDPRKMEETKSRLRYAFAGTLDNSASIGAMLAQFVQYDRDPETVNEMYAQFEALTPEDVRAMADRYFTDQTRVTVTLSDSAEMVGFATTASLDSLAEARGMQAAAASAPFSADDNGREEVFAPRGEAAPVSLVARPSASSPLIDVSIIVHAGAAMDPGGKKGLATLTASMLTDGGSGTWSIQEINAAMYPLASGFNAQVDKEMTRLSGQVHKDNLGTWYRYVRSQLLNPGWHEQDFERLKTQLTNAVRTGLVGNNDEELGKEVLYGAIYGPDHPYGSLNLGHSGDIEGLTLDDVRGFYADYYVINNMTIGLSGGYPDDFPGRLSADLQRLPAGEKAIVDLPELADAAENSVVIVAKETPAVAVSFGYPINLRRGDPDWIALWLVRSWLGEHRSENSHLYQRIREARGMNYGSYAYIEYFPQGMFTMRPGTNYARQHQVFQVWLRPLRDNNDAHFATRAAVYALHKLVGDGMDETDFEATRSYLSKSVSLLTDGQSRQLGYALDSQYYEIDEFTDYVRAGLDDLTLADVNRVIREHLRAEDMQFVFVTRDAADLKARLAEGRPSPVSYDAEKPTELLDEDAALSVFGLDLDESAISILPAETVFD